MGMIVSGSRHQKGGWNLRTTGSWIGLVVCFMLLACAGARNGVNYFRHYTYWMWMLSALFYLYQVCYPFWGCTFGYVKLFYASAMTCLFTQLLVVFVIHFIIWDDTGVIVKWVSSGESERELFVANTVLHSLPLILFPWTIDMDMLKLCTATLVQKRIFWEMSISCCIGFPMLLVVTYSMVFDFEVEYDATVSTYRVLFWSLGWLLLCAVFVHSWLFGDAKGFMVTQGLDHFKTRVFANFQFVENLS